MTKKDVGGTRTGGDDVADFDIGIGYDHAVNKQLNQLSVVSPLSVVRRCDSLK
jgi:hypothetical protein